MGFAFHVIHGTDRKHRKRVGMMESTKKRKYLTLEDRVNVVNRHKKGETAIAIAKSLKVGKTQIQGIIRDKDDILKRWESGDNADHMRSKRQKTTYSEVNEKVFPQQPNPLCLNFVKKLLI